jgi:hypothetical protein
MIALFSLDYPQAGVDSDIVYGDNRRFFCGLRRNKNEELEVGQADFVKSY